MNDSITLENQPTANERRFRARGKVRPILQTELSECGLACVAMIGGFYGYETDLVSFRQRFPISQNGSDLDDLGNISKEIGLASRALQLDLDEIGQLELPCILHWDTNHFVVLTKCDKKFVTIVDPAVGQRRVSHKELDQRFTGIALELSPTHDFTEAQERKKLGLFDLWERIVGLKRSLAQVIGLSLVVHFLTIVVPLYTQITVDTVIGKGQWGILPTVSLGFAMIIITQNLITYLRSMVILHLSSRLQMQMSANLFNHLIHLPMSYFIRRSLGDIISRFGSLSAVRQMIANGFVSAILDGLMLVITLGVMLYYSLILTGIIMVALSLYIAVRYYLFSLIKRITQEKIVADAKEASHFMETMHAVQPLKLFRQESQRTSQWLSRLTAVINKDIEIKKWDSGFHSINSIIFGLENILVIYVASLLIGSNQLTLGMLFAFMTFKSNFVTSANSLIMIAIDFKMLDVHFERISDIAFQKTEVSSLTTKKSKPAHSFNIQGQIEAIKLSFKYEGAEEFVFENVSFKILPGESVAITGPSGCGKSTLLKCLVGLMTPSSGQILIDGVPLKEVINYRSQISTVMQDDQLISGSLKENITFFSNSVDQEKVVKSASLACIANDIEKMPMRYESLVGELGSSLSGGQKQRVILARALYKEPSILFMDEATSHLDVECESTVNANIGSLLITRVFVAHRPETVRSARKQIKLA